jgi:hypothetical protein
VIEIGNKLCLDFEVRRIRKMLEESWPQKVAEQAEQSRRTSEQMAGYEKWGRNHPENPDAA